MIKKPWAFITVPYMNPTILRVIELGFLNQVPTLRDRKGGDEQTNFEAERLAINSVWFASCHVSHSRIILVEGDF